MTITITRVAWDSADASALRAAQRAELDGRYGSDDHEPGTPPSAGDIELFLIATDATGAPVGCGGLRLLGEGRAEIKRMYVVPAARGTGVSTAVLRALESEATALDLTELLLETGTAQPDAIRFYEREGYSSIPAFGAYLGSELSLCYSRRLGAPGLGT